MSISQTINDDSIKFDNNTENHPTQEIFALVDFKRTLDKEIALFLFNSRNVGKTRDQICKNLNAARSSVYDSLNRMVLMDIIEQDHKILNKANKGRPSTLFFLKNTKQGNRR